MILAVGKASLTGSLSNGNESLHDYINWSFDNEVEHVK